MSACLSVVCAAFGSLVKPGQFEIVYCPGKRLLQASWQQLWTSLPAILTPVEVLALSGIKPLLQFLLSEVINATKLLEQLH